MASVFFLYNDYVVYSSPNVLLCKHILSRKNGILTKSCIHFVKVDLSGYFYHSVAHKILFLKYFGSY